MKSLTLFFYPKAKEKIKNGKEEMYSPENHDLGAGIVLMKLDELHSFEGHPFKVEKNQELFELRCSIEKEGVSQFGVGRYPVTSALKR